MCGTKNSSLLGKISVLVVICFFWLPAHAKYGGGTGEPNDPYQIWDANHMQAIGEDLNDWDKCFRLMADIDLSGFTGASFNIIGYFVAFGSPDNKPFTGVFDGNSHTISNFSYTCTGKAIIGLFRYVSDPNAAIKDLGLIDPNVDAGTGSMVGGLVGLNYPGTITNCYVKGGSVAGYNNVGGLVGGNVSRNSKISDCYSEGSVQGYSYIGGLVGYNSYTITMTNCYATGDVSGNRSVGGLVGQNNYGKNSSCYASGSVSGENNIGGLVGDNDGGIIMNCYSTGSVSGANSVGGLVGRNYYGIVKTSFWDIETSGRQTSAGGTGKTTDEMYDPNTFMETGWDFIGQPDGPSDVWAVPVGGGYPILWWQLSPWPLLPGFSGGTGEADDYYLISMADELNSIGHNPRLMAKHFKLINDIDLAGTDFFPIGSEVFPFGGVFGGVFDGNSHIISNFSYTSTGRHFIGVFEYVGLGGELKDLGLIQPNVDAGTGNYVGSLVGWLNGGTITTCFVEEGSVSGNRYVGGLVGHNYFGTICNCYSSGSFSGNRDVGGLIGVNVGEGIINNCYSTGSVSGTIEVGGLMGWNRHGSITNCYATGNISGADMVGGLVGMTYALEKVIDSFWDIETGGPDNGIGIPLTTDQMQTESTFIDAGWDFVDVWSICEQTNYPRFSGQVPIGDFLCPDGVNFVDFSFFAGHWQDDNCGASNDCDGTDLNLLGTVDINDLGIFVDNWLKGF